MSVAYFLVLDNPSPGFDTFVNGKFVGKEADRLNRIARELGLKSIDDFVSMDAFDVEDDLGDMPEMEQVWFEPDEGLTWVQSLADHIRNHSQGLKNPKGVLDDLAEYIHVLKQAETAGCRWRFEVDI